QVYLLASIRGAVIHLGAAFGHRLLTEALVALAPGLALLLEAAGPRAHRGLLGLGGARVGRNLPRVGPEPRFLVEPGRPPPPPPACGTTFAGWPPTSCAFSPARRRGYSRWGCCWVTPVPARPGSTNGKTAQRRLRLRRGFKTIRARSVSDGLAAVPV